MYIGGAGRRAIKGRALDNLGYRLVASIPFGLVDGSASGCFW